MNLTELKAFIAQVEEGAKGVSPDDVTIWGIRNLKNEVKPIKIDSLSASFLPKYITYEQKESEGAA